MINDLPALAPEVVVVDTIDRFSRNLKDGHDLLERFKGMRVSLLALDWDEPINLDDLRRVEITGDVGPAMAEIAMSRVERV